MIFLPNLTFSSVCMDKIQTQDSVKHHLSAQFSNHVFFFFVGLECLFLFFIFLLGSRRQRNCAAAISSWGVTCFFSFSFSVCHSAEFDLSYTRG